LGFFYGTGSSGTQRKDDGRSAPRKRIWEEVRGGGKMQHYRRDFSFPSESLLATHLKKKGVLPEKAGNRCELRRGKRAEKEKKREFKEKETADYFPLARQGGSHFDFFWAKRAEPF